MPGLYLYSVVPWLKWMMYREYFGDRHYAWCAEVFDRRNESHTSLNRHLGASSNPAEIYSTMKAAVESNDQGDLRIEKWRSALPTYAVKAWHAGEMTEDHKDHVIYLAKEAKVEAFRPLVYVIRWDLVKGRAEPAKPNRTSGMAREYIIPDLRGKEFDAIAP